MSSSYELNTDQQLVFEACISGRESILCTGQGGTGKSILLSAIVSHFKSIDVENASKIAVTASTGVAAYLIGGITLHRFAGTGIEENDIDNMIFMASRKNNKKVWQNTDILIIDEVSMLSATLFDNLSKVAQMIRKSSLPFGGIRLILFGDFLQLPPISRNRTRVKRIFESDIWEQLNPMPFELRDVIRQQNPVITTVLESIRVGMCTNSMEAYIQDLARDIEVIDSIEPVRLYALKDRVNSYNSDRLEKLDGQNEIYMSHDHGQVSTLKQCPGLEILELKIGAQVMLIRNLNRYLVNGSIGTIIRFESIKDSEAKYPVVSMLMSNGMTYKLTIGPVEWRMSMPDDTLISSRIQIPLILAWAITIHKSQGQTIPRLSIDMNGIFEKGQAYVALSRCINPDNMQVLNFKKENIMADKECVIFHYIVRQQMDRLRHPSNPPSHNPPEYNEEASATEVADVTNESWETNTVSLEEAMQNLSVRPTSPPLYQESEK